MTIDSVDIVAPLCCGDVAFCNLLYERKGTHMEEHRTLTFARSLFIFMSIVGKERRL